MPTGISPVVVGAGVEDVLVGVDLLEVKVFFFGVAYLVGVDGKDLLLENSQPYSCGIVYIWYYVLEDKRK